MTTVTLRPTAVTVIYGGFTGAVAASLADDNDATSMQNSFGQAHSRANIGFAGFAIPAGAEIRTITPRIRWNTGSGSTGIAFAIYDGINTGVFTNLPGNSPVTTTTGFALTGPPSGGTWTQAMVNACQVQVFAPDTNAATILKEVYLDIVYNTAPVPTGVALGSVTTSRPTFDWTYSDADNDPQESYRVKVFSKAQYEAVGFDATNSIPTLDSGTIYNLATQWTATADLINGATYRGYVFVSDLGSGGRLSAAGPYSSVTIALQSPAVPELTATPSTAYMAQSLVLQDRQNMLSLNDFSFETTIGGWFLVANCTISRIAYGSAEEGGYVLDMVAGASTATMQAQSGNAEPSIMPGRTYSARVGFRSVSVNRQVRCDIRWYNAAGTLLSTTAGVVVTEISGTLTPSYCTAVAPAGTTRAAVVATIVGPVTASTEHHYIDTATLVPFALNMLSDPAFELDSDSNGVADNWTMYNYPGTDAAPVMAMSTYSYVGVSSQAVTWTANTGFKGVQQALPPLKSGQTYTISVWCGASSYALMSLFCDAPATFQNTVITLVGGWSLLTRTFTVTADTPTSNVFISSPTVGPITIWIAAAQLELGATPSNVVDNLKPFPPGGMTTPARFEVQRSDDGGFTWKTLQRIFWAAGQYDYNLVNFSDESQSLTAYDQEAPRNVAVIYRVRTKAVVGVNTLISTWSPWITAAPLPTTGWWLKSIYDDRLNQVVHMGSETLDWQSKESHGVNYALGRKAAVVISDVVHGEELEVTLSMLTDWAYEAFESLRSSGDTVLLQSPYGDNHYVRFGPVRSSTHLVTANGKRLRSINIRLIETDAP